MALESAERADLFAVQNQPGNPSLKPFVKNESFLESLTADLIKTADYQLAGMLKAKQITIPVIDVCKLYARLVVGHEKDVDSQTIVDELIRVDLLVRAGVCR